MFLNLKFLLFLLTLMSVAPLTKSNNPLEYFVSIRIDRVNKVSAPGADHACGGTLIKANRVISAAHCFFHVNSKGKEIYVVAKYVYVVYHTKNAYVPDYEAQAARVSNISLHPKFHPSNVSHDISILSLSKNLVLVSGLNIKLPDKLPLIGENVFISGMGKLYPQGPLVGILVTLNLTLIDCSERIMTPLNFSICAEGDIRTNVKGVCRGDSGGGLVSSSSTLIGVLNAGYFCGQYNDPAIYCNVFLYRKWIEKTITFLDMQTEIGQAFRSKTNIIFVIVVLFFSI